MIGYGPVLSAVKLKAKILANAIIVVKPNAVNFSFYIASKVEF